MNDQTCFSDTLTSARPLMGCKNPRLSGSGFNTPLGVQQMLMNKKNMFDPRTLYEPRNSYTMGCPPVRGDNPRALASGLSYVQVDKHGITILCHLHQCRPCTSSDIPC